GPDLDTIDRVSKEIETALKPINGQRDVVATPIMGKGYLEIYRDLEREARYGVTVEDIKNTVEIALGGQAVTQTVEGRERFPVRIRYPRAQREDEETVRRLLVNGSGMGRRPELSNAMGAGATEGAAQGPAAGGMGGQSAHQAAPGHQTKVSAPLQVPLSSVADVRI